MAELAAGALGAVAAAGAAAYTASVGFIGRHEGSHLTQLHEIRTNAATFERAYATGDINEWDWQEYQRLKREYEVEQHNYAESMEQYKDVPFYKFLRKFKTRQRVRECKRQTEKAVRFFRSHCSDSMSEASDTSSVVASAGSPPRTSQYDPYNDDKHKQVKQWADEVVGLDSDVTPVPLPAAPSANRLHHSLPD